jgi:hypothetical protein
MFPTKDSRIEASSGSGLFSRSDVTPRIIPGVQ